MKKLLLTALTVLACGAANALPVGNPSDASLLCDGLIWEGHCGDPCDPCLSWCNAVSFRLGFYGDYVFNRHMEVDTQESGADIEHTEIYTNAAFLAGNIYDRFDLFVTLGATNIFIETNASAFNATPGNRFIVETETAFSWSIGARGTLWQCGCTTLGVEGQYFYTSPDVTRVTRGGTLSLYNGDLLGAKYREWQVGIGISHRINIFVPYMAIQWSRAKLDFDNAAIGAPINARLNDLKSDKLWGYAVGVSVVDCEKASVTVEGRFGSEKAVYVNGQIRL